MNNITFIKGIHCKKFYTIKGKNTINMYIKNSIFKNELYNYEDINGICKFLLLELNNKDKFGNTHAVIKNSYKINYDSNMMFKDGFHCEFFANKSGNATINIFIKTREFINELDKNENENGYSNYIFVELASEDKYKNTHILIQNTYNPNEKKKQKTK